MSSSRPSLWSGWWPIFFVLCAMASGCGNGGGGSPASPFYPEQFIVEPAQLPGLLAQPGVVLIAARSALETLPLGYVNNAVEVDVDAWTSFSEADDNLFDYASWSAMIGGLGIGGHSQVLVYDDGELKFAARIRFLLAHFGVTNANLINGGFAGMQPLISSGQLQLQAGPTPPDPVSYTAFGDQEPIPMVFQQDVAAALGDPALQLIDVRTPAEFDGQLLIPPVTRGGHIPGAQNLPIAEFFAPSQPTELMTGMELADFFTRAGLNPDARTIVYCQDGAKSSLAALAMLNAHFSNFALYYLSYANWQANPKLPVAQ